MTRISKEARNNLLFGITVTVAVAVSLVLFNLYLNLELDKYYKLHKLSCYVANGLPEKDKGEYLIRRSLDEKAVMLHGSSELGSYVMQNPKRFFPNSKLSHPISMIGHAYVQNLLHGMNFGANFCVVDNPKIAIVESLQWFMWGDIDFDGFMANFSELQFYQFLHNYRISDKNRKYLSERFYQLYKNSDNSIAQKLASIAETNGTESDVYKFATKLAEKNLIIGDGGVFPRTFLLARMNASNGFVWKVLRSPMEPYYWLRYRYMLFKDKIDVLKWLKEIEGKDTVTSKQIDWELELTEAERQGKQACTNNSWYVNDEYYTKYLAENIAGRKDDSKGTQLLVSQEWKDYEFMLSVCNELGLNPHIVIMSTNGLYYDHIGISKQQREEYYVANEKLAKSHGMKVLNLAPFEYQPYFYCDVMHLGWKGWLHVDKYLVENFSK